jgi:N-acylneuraminate cytidylyltransferase
MQDRFYDKDSKPINHNPNKLERTQDLEPLYKENSNFYLFSKDSFIKNNNRIGNNPFKFEMSRIESIDIDNQEDWDLAEKLASYNSSHD